MTLKNMPKNPKAPKDKSKGDKNKHHDKGKHHGKGKGKHHGRRGGNYGAYAGYKGVPRKRAKRLVDAEINPLLRDIAREIQHNRMLYDRTKGDLDYVFGEAGNYLKHLGNENEESFEDFGRNQEAAKAALLQQMQQSGNNNARGAMNELQRLGLGDQFLGQMVADQQHASNMANAQMGHTRENAELMNMGSQSFNTALMGMNRGSHVSNVGQALNARNQSIFDLRRDRRDLKQQRPELMRQMLEQMAAQGWGQYVDQRNIQQNARALNLQAKGQAFAQNQASQSQASQNAYNSTLSSLYQQQLANTYKR